MKTALHILLAILIKFLLPNEAPAQGITFTFNPPDSAAGTEYISEIETTTFMFEEETTRTNAQASFLFEKTDTAYILTSILEQSQSLRNGEEVENYEFDALVGLPFILLLDTDGRLDSIIGYEAIRDSITKKDPTGYSQYAPESHEYEPYFINVSRTWKNHIGDFHGKTAEIGDTWNITDTVSNIEYTEINSKTITFTELIEYNETECVLIKFEHSIDLEFTDYYEEALGKMLFESEEPTEYFELLGGTASMKGKWILDPATMLYYYEHEERTETVQIKVYGGMEVSIQTETISETRTKYENKD